MIITDEPGSCPICGMDLTPVKAGTAGPAASAAETGQRKIKYWVAPMDPTYIRDEPGKSPMGMDLVPVYEDQAVSGATISIDPVTAQNMGTAHGFQSGVDRHRLIRTAAGTADCRRTDGISINAKVDGWIEKLYVGETGQMVTKGQPLLELYSPKLVSAQQEYLVATEPVRPYDSAFAEIFARAAACSCRTATALLGYQRSADPSAGENRAGPQDPDPVCAL
ncbi:MAG: heavy metal-binding domain-containing protein [Syntrophotaleaceae bacterium]